MHGASSREKRRCGTKILRLKPGEKGVQPPDVLPLGFPSGNRGYGTKESGSLSETSDSRSVSTCKKDLSSKAMVTPDTKAAVDEE